MLWTVVISGGGMDDFIIAVSPCKWIAEELADEWYTELATAKDNRIVQVRALMTKRPLDWLNEEYNEKADREDRHMETRFGKDDI